MGMRAKRDTGPASEEPGPWERSGWTMGVVWLVFLYFPGRSLVESDAAMPWRVLGWTGMLVFAVSYVVGFIAGMGRGWHRPTPLVWSLFAAMAFGALLSIPAIAWDAASFVPFLMAYASYCTTRRWHWIATIAGLVLAGLYLSVELSGEEEPSWTLPAVVLIMAAVNTITTRLILRSIVSDEVRMELMKSEERESIARDVHDLLGHSLTVVKLKAELASRLVEQDPERARAELTEIALLAGEALHGVRSTVTGLRTEDLESQLRASAAALAAAGISVRVMGRPEALSPAQAIPASWVLREATTNILRHAAAKSVDIVIEPGSLVVEDDGDGRRRAQAGNGMLGMAERAASSGATLRFEDAGGDLRTAGRGGRPGGAGTRVSLSW